MTTYKSLVGQKILKVSTDPSNPLEGQVWYNTSSDTFKSVIAIEAWSSGGSLGTARYALGAAGTQDAGLVAGAPTATEEFTGETETANIEDFTTS